MWSFRCHSMCQIFLTVLKVVHAQYDQHHCTILNRMPPLSFAECIWVFGAVLKWVAPLRRACLPASQIERLADLLRERMIRYTPAAERTVCLLLMQYEYSSVCGRMRFAVAAPAHGARAPARAPAPAMPVLV